jgi:homotetrameric cytidine deaminase
MPLSKVKEEDRQRLLRAAAEAARNAYAPYSGLRVGAALLTRQGHLFAGVNVENASFGLTICAEGAAVAAAVAGEGAAMRVRALAVVNDALTPCPPCGACRQVILELGPEAVVIFQGPKGLEEKKISELLPEAFRLP